MYMIYLLTVNKSSTTFGGTWHSETQRALWADHFLATGPVKGLSADKSFTSSRESLHKMEHCAHNWLETRGLRGEYNSCFTFFDGNPVRMWM